MSLSLLRELLLEFSLIAGKVAISGDDATLLALNLF